MWYSFATGIVALAVLVLPLKATAQQQSCGDPPPVVNKNVKGELEGKARFLSRYLGDASLSSQIETSRSEIFSKYPDAELSRSNSYFEYQVCILLMQDKRLSTKEKLAELIKIRREFSKPIPELVSKQDGFQPLYSQSKPGDIVKDCDVCPAMVVVPAGNFLMGSPKAQKGHKTTEEPQHPVEIPNSVAVGKYEITREQYGHFVNATGFVGDKRSCSHWDEQKQEYIEDRGTSFLNPGIPQDDHHPVTCVNWEDAKAYVEWLSKKTGHKYRLLTEAEWEYAARAGTATARYFGGTTVSACEYANGADLTFLGKFGKFKGILNVDCADGYIYTAPVGKFTPPAPPDAHAWPLYDMLGNVWEWVEDCWHESYEEPLPDGIAPADGTAWTTGTCGQHVVRGGSWDGGPENLRSARRSGSTPDIRSNSFGFRVAATLP